MKARVFQINEPVFSFSSCSHAIYHIAKQQAKSRQGSSKANWGHSSTKEIKLISPISIPEQNISNPNHCCSLRICLVFPRIPRHLFLNQFSVYFHVLFQLSLTILRSLFLNSRLIILNHPRWNNVIPQEHPRSTPNTILEFANGVIKLTDWLTLVIRNSLVLGRLTHHDVSAPNIRQSVLQYYLFLHRIVSNRNWNLFFIQY